MLAGCKIERCCFTLISGISLEFFGRLIQFLWLTQWPVIFIVSSTGLIDLLRSIDFNTYNMGVCAFCEEEGDESNTLKIRLMHTQIPHTRARTQHFQASIALNKSNGLYLLIEWIPTQSLLFLLLVKHGSHITYALGSNHIRIYSTALKFPPKLRPPAPPNLFFMYFLWWRYPWNL